MPELHDDFYGPGLDYSHMGADLEPETVRKNPYITSVSELDKTDIYLEPATTHKNPYVIDVSGLDKMDIYSVLILYGVKDPEIAHAIKKLLVPGGRGVKGKKQDIEEAVKSLERWLELEEQIGHG